MPKFSDFPRPDADWKQWAEAVVAHVANTSYAEEEVTPNVIMLRHLLSSELARAVNPGLLMYDPVKGLPVIADGAEFRELALMKDNVSSSYMIVGGMLIQWGKEAASVASETVTFPTPFNDTNAIVVVSAQTHAYPSTIGAVSFLMTGTNTEDKFWVAMGAAVP